MVVVVSSDPLVSYSISFSNCEDSWSTPALLVEAEETPPKIQGDPHRPEPTAEGNIQMEYSSKYRSSNKKLPVRI